MAQLSLAKENPRKSIIYPFPLSHKPKESFCPIVIISLLLTDKFTEESDAYQLESPKPEAQKVANHEQIEKP